ncbi:hypothetical protein CR513_25255, partial [Mucuna pruriens]
MILLVDGTVDNDSSKSKSSSISVSNASYEYLLNKEGDMLIVRREDNASQRENIFHSRCHVIGQLCSIIIDGGSSINVTSTRLLEKLKLPIGTS